MTISIAKAIKALGGTEFTITGEPSNESEYQANVKYISGVDSSKSAVFKDTQDYTWSQVSAKQSELQTTYDGLAYARARAEAYAEIKEQLDLLYHDMAADKGDKTGEWFKHIKAVKDANSKE